MIISRKYILIIITFLSISCKKEDKLIIKTEQIDNFKIVEEKHQDSLDVSNFYIYNQNNILIKKYRTINELKDGLEFSYFNNGNIEYIANFKNDKLNGISKFFYNNKVNSIEQICNYEDGETIGNQIKYNSKGELEYHIGLNFNKDIVFKLTSSNNAVIEEGRYKLMGVFDKLKYSVKDRIVYKVYFAEPENISLKYSFSFCKDGNDEKWISARINNSIVRMDTLILEKGIYTLKEKLEIFNSIEKTTKIEHYKFNIKIE